MLKTENQKQLGNENLEANQEGNKPKIENWTWATVDNMFANQNAENRF